MFTYCIYQLSILFSLLFAPDIRQHRGVPNKLHISVLELRLILNLFILSQLMALELQQRGLVRYIRLLETWLWHHILLELLLHMFWLQMEKRRVTLIKFWM